MNKDTLRNGNILWASSNSSHGQCLGEFLHMLSVRPKWQSNGRISGLEVIFRRIEERPRIDVMGVSVALIRDMMPYCHMARQGC